MKSGYLGQFQMLQLPEKFFLSHTKKVKNERKLWNHQLLFFIYRKKVFEVTTTDI